MSRTPTPQMEDERESRAASTGGWTPQRGLVRGSAACLIAGAILGGAWCALAWRRPDVVVSYTYDDVEIMAIMGALSAIVTFMCCWILFAVMHHYSQMAGGLCPVIVIGIMAGIIVAKQLTVAATPGVDLPDGPVVGGAWLAPKMFVMSNLGAWIGLAVGVYACKDGESPLELFH